MRNDAERIRRRAREVQARLRQTCQRRIRQVEAELSGELPAARPAPENQERLEQLRTRLGEIERGEWPGVDPQVAAALQQGSTDGAPSPEAGAAGSGESPGDPAPGDEEAEDAASFILTAGRGLRVRADEREPVEVGPEAERAAAAILAADTPDEDASAAARKILGAGR